jgi:hypothetical protein
MSLVSLQPVSSQPFGFLFDRAYLAGKLAIAGITSPSHEPRALGAPEHAIRQVSRPLAPLQDRPGPGHVGAADDAERNPAAEPHRPILSAHLAAAALASQMGRSLLHHEQK